MKFIRLANYVSSEHEDLFVECYRELRKVLQYLLHTPPGEINDDEFFGVAIPLKVEYWTETAKFYQIVIAYANSRNDLDQLKSKMRDINRKMDVTFGPADADDIAGTSGALIELFLDVRSTVSVFLGTETIDDRIRSPEFLETVDTVRRNLAEMVAGIMGTIDDVVRINVTPPVIEEDPLGLEGLEL